MKDFDEWINGTFFGECFQGYDRLNLQVAFNAGKQKALDDASKRIADLDKKLSQAIELLGLVERIKT